jgi:hypothetical protein
MDQSGITLQLTSSSSSSSSVDPEEGEVGEVGMLAWVGIHILGDIVRGERSEREEVKVDERSDRTE